MGDWIKVEKDTPDKQEIFRIACRLGISKEEAFAMCFRFWAWADSNFADGVIPDLSPAGLDATLAHKQGFAEAIISVGWLARTNGGLVITNFERHLGQSAKKRALAARAKMVRLKSRKSSARSATPSISISNSSSVSSSGKEGGSGGNHRGINFAPPTLEEVRAYCAERRNSVDAQQWHNHYTSNGWMVGKVPMRDWRGAVRTWEKNSFFSKGSTANERTKYRYRGEPAGEAGGE